MQQSVYSAQINKSAIIGETTNRASHCFALTNLGVPTILGDTLFFFGKGATVDHDIFLGRIELDDAAANFLSDEFLHARRHRVLRCARLA